MFVDVLQMFPTQVLGVVTVFFVVLLYYVHEVRSSPIPVTKLASPRFFRCCVSSLTSILLRTNAYPQAKVDYWNGKHELMDEKRKAEVAMCVRSKDY